MSSDAASAPLVGPQPFMVVTPSVDLARFADSWKRTFTSTYASYRFLVPGRAQPCQLGGMFSTTPEGGMAIWQLFYMVNGKKIVRLRHSQAVRPIYAEHTGELSWVLFNGQSFMDDFLGAVTQNKIQVVNVEKEEAERLEKEKAALKLQQEKEEAEKKAADALRVAAEGQKPQPLVALGRILESEDNSVVSIDMNEDEADDDLCGEDESTEASSDAQRSAKSLSPEEQEAEQKAKEKQEAEKRRQEILALFAKLQLAKKDHVFQQVCAEQYQCFAIHSKTGEITNLPLIGNDSCATLLQDFDQIKLSKKFLFSCYLPRVPAGSRVYIRCNATRHIVPVARPDNFSILCICALDVELGTHKVQQLYLSQLESNKRTMKSLNAGIGPLTAQLGQSLAALIKPEPSNAQHLAKLFVHSKTAVRAPCGKKDEEESSKGKVSAVVADNAKLSTKQPIVVQQGASVSRGKVNIIKAEVF